MCISGKTYGSFLIWENYRHTRFCCPPIRAGSKTASRETGRNPYRSIRPKHEPDHLTPPVQTVKLNEKNLKLHP
ncbi:hypothetical protein CXT99_10400 [Akkermansia muciniphila]|nr:hypothetical protein CXU00_09990 [Akkermansia muciniphila]PNC65064.1 hypothetical protein CXT99_10400 [Akkermansia muciniphila]QAT92577.1 hypothetical protein AKKM5201_11980 [Akkermansia muciniphila]